MSVLLGASFYLKKASDSVHQELLREILRLEGGRGQIMRKSGFEGVLGKE